jgi:hypothetical protein
LNIPNEEAFSKADFAANQWEQEHNHKLSSEDYSEFVWWYMMELKHPRVGDYAFTPVSISKSTTIEETG